MFETHGGTVRAVDNVSLALEKGETLALVGESGCGKTTLARSILGLQALSGGSIRLKEKSITEWKRTLVQEVGMVWQDPYASLNPRWTIERSIQEPCRLAKAPCDTEKILTMVGLDPSYGLKYPRELSGGQRQRAVIGRAIALNPSLVICDEPTAALDLSIRAQILNLLKSIQASNQSSFLYISHDLSTVKFIAKHVAVMYLGSIVEQGPAAEVFEDPRHPYTLALIESAPSLDRLMSLPDPLPGEVPDPRVRIQGCRFHNRCKFAQDRCRSEAPERTIEGSRSFCCHFPLRGTEAGKETSQ